MARISIASSKVVVRGSGVAGARAISRSVSGASASSTANVGDRQRAAGATDVHKRAGTSNGGSSAVAEGWASGAGAEVIVDAKAEDGK